MNEQTKYDGDERIFSLYLAEVKNTLEPIEIIYFNKWMDEIEPKTINDVDHVVADIFDISVNDYRQFAEQVVDFEESVAEDTELLEWIASE